MAISSHNREVERYFGWGFPEYFPSSLLWSSSLVVYRELDLEPVVRPNIYICIKNKSTEVLVLGRRDRTFSDRTTPGHHHEIEIPWKVLSNRRFARIRLGLRCRANKGALDIS